MTNSSFRVKVTIFKRRRRHARGQNLRLVRRLSITIMSQLHYDGRNGFRACLPSLRSKYLKEPRGTSAVLLRRSV